MRRGDNIIIAKRDGSLEPFQLGKLRRCLARVLDECHHDHELAQPIAEAVGIHIRQWRDKQPPSSEYLYYCVRAVLRQTGFDDAAELLAEHRRQRRAAPRRPRVFAADRRQGGSISWSREQLEATLRDRYGLGATVAHILAGEIDTRVLRLGYHWISTTLVDELVRNELAAWGLLEEPATETSDQPHMAPAGSPPLRWKED